MKYGINSYPTFVLIDPNGKIVSRFSGFGKDDDGKGSLEKEIEHVLEKTK
ncbi:TlpA family protein disulfide reductase [Pedobacter sp. UC225_65]